LHHALDRRRDERRCVEKPKPAQQRQELAWATAHGLPMSNSTLVLGREKKSRLFKTSAYVVVFWYCGLLSASNWLRNSSINTS
jgi:hypothetical protein